MEMELDMLRSRVYVLETIVNKYHNALEGFIKSEMYNLIEPNRDSCDSTMSVDHLRQLSFKEI